MTIGDNGSNESGRSNRPVLAFALAVMLAAVIPAAVSAQMFTDRPPVRRRPPICLHR